MSIVRFGVSLEKEHIDTLDIFMRDCRIKNRSQAIRQLISKIKLEDRKNKDEQAGGCIMLSYDHHKRELLDKLNNIQHDHHNLILCSQHIHINHNVCMEIVAVKGKVSELKDLANELISVKGIFHGELSLTLVD